MTATIAAFAVAMLLLVAGCRGDADPAATGSGSRSDPIGSIEATIDSVESGFAADSTAGH